MKTSVLHIIFDEKLGPITQNWLPTELDADLREKVPMLVMNISSNMQELPKGVAIIPIPAHGMKALVHLIRFEDAKRRGGTGEAALVLLFDEADDAVVYRYMKQFESIFEKHGTVARQLLEKRGTKAQGASMLATFHKDVAGLLEVLELEEKKETAFPLDDEKEEKEPYKCKIVVIGDPDVGKTSLVIQFTEKAFRKTYLPTIGVNITEKTVSHGSSLIAVVRDGRKPAKRLVVLEMRVRHDGRIFHRRNYRLDIRVLDEKLMVWEKLVYLSHFPSLRSFSTTFSAHFRNSM